ncbi:MAG: hypothetical protein ACE5GL_03435 [Calditrichia bacterium]
MIKRLILTSLLPVLTVSLWAGDNPLTSVVESRQFKDYWYHGKAELNRYKLEQARYGEIHKGDAVLIFVTENFLTDLQVKHEYGEAKSATTVLKLNFGRYFVTGIYPYSILTSVFSPVNLNRWEHSLKLSGSTQEWCGQVYSQLNLRGDEYKGLLHSYFQKEADQQIELPETWLEDEIWTRIRLAPNSLPTGEFKIIPALYFMRFKHLDFKIYSAHAAMTTASDPALSDKELKIYTLKYGDLDRELKIKFENEFPFAIVGWEETFESGWGDKAKHLTTKAVRTHTLFTDYWTKNSVADSTYRKKLGL